MVTADPEDVIERDDHTTLIVGDAGTPLPQSGDGSIQTVKGTVAREDASEAFDTDLADGDFVFGPADFSGTDSISGSAESDDGNNLEVQIEYLDANDNPVGVELTFGPDTQVEFVSIPHRFDRLRLTVTDTSGAAQNNVTGSVYVV